MGVSPNGAGMDRLEANDSAHSTERIMSAREMLVQMMVRSVAETGLKPAYTMVRDLLSATRRARRLGKFRGRWMNVNPSISWGDRSRIRVAVNTGAY